MYVVRQSVIDASVLVIDTATNNVIATITTGTGSQQEFTLSLDGISLFVPRPSIDSITVINTSSFTVVATIGVGDFPQEGKLSVDGQYFYSAGRSSDNLSIIRVDSYLVIATVTLGDQPRVPTVGSDGRIYINNMGTPDSISVIDGILFTNIATITVSGGLNKFPTLSLDESLLFTANGSSNASVTVVDTNTYTVIATVTVGIQPQITNLSKDGTKLFVPAGGSSAVNVIDTTTFNVIATVTVPSGPIWNAISPDGSLFYVSSQATPVLTAIDTNTLVVKSSLSVTPSPTQPVLSEFGTVLYLTCLGGNVLVIPTCSACITPYGSCKTNVFLTQKELFNRITWFKPIGVSEELEYRIFTDSDLTNQIGTVVSSDAIVAYTDHNKKNRSVSTYYVQILYPNNEKSLGSVTVECR